MNFHAIVLRPFVILEMYITVAIDVRGPRSDVNVSLFQPEPPVRFIRSREDRTQCPSNSVWPPTWIDIGCYFVSGFVEEDYNEQVNTAALRGTWMIRTP